MRGRPVARQPPASRLRRHTGTHPLGACRALRYHRSSDEARDHLPLPADAAALGAQLTAAGPGRRGHDGGVYQGALLQQQPRSRNRSLTVCSGPIHAKRAARQQGSNEVRDPSDRLPGAPSISGGCLIRSVGGCIYPVRGPRRSASPAVLLAQVAPQRIAEGGQRDLVLGDGECRGAAREIAPQRLNGSNRRQGGCLRAEDSWAQAHRREPCGVRRSLFCRA